MARPRSRRLRRLPLGFLPRRHPRSSRRDACRRHGAAAEPLRSRGSPLRRALTRLRRPARHHPARRRPRLLIPAWPKEHAILLCSAPATSPSSSMQRKRSIGLRGESMVLVPSTCPPLLWSAPLPSSCSSLSMSSNDTDGTAAGLIRWRCNKKLRMKSLAEDIMSWAFKPPLSCT